MSVLIMLGIWAAMLVGAWLWGRRRGFRAHYLDTWAFDAGEKELWRDDFADIAVVGTMARAAIIRPWRLHRYRVVVTSSRILIATGELFTRKPRVVYVLYFGSAPPSTDTGNTGGVFKTGYTAMVVAAGGISRHAARRASGSYVALVPDRSVLSSFACAEFRIYTDRLDSFPVG